MSRFYNGWVKVHRSIDNPDNQKNIFADRPMERELFLWLVRNANYVDGKTPLKGHKDIVLRGQIVTGYPDMAKGTDRTITKVRRAIEWLKLTGQLTVKTTNKGSVITILDYSKFQDREQADEQANPQANPQADEQASDRQMSRPVTGQRQAGDTLLKNIRIQEANKGRKKELKKESVPLDLLNLSEDWASHTASATTSPGELNRIDSYVKGVKAIMRHMEWDVSQVRTMFEWIIKDEFWHDKCLSPEQMPKLKYGKRKINSVLTEMKRIHNKNKAMNDFINSDDDTNPFQ